RADAGEGTSSVADTFVEGPPPLPAWVPANLDDPAGPHGSRTARDVPAAEEPQDRRRSHGPDGDDRRSVQRLGTRRAAPQRDRQRPPEPDPTPPPPRKRQRDPYLDNVKFLLITLVPLGHALVPTLAA